MLTFQIVVQPLRFTEDGKVNDSKADTNCLPSEITALHYCSFTELTDVSAMMECSLRTYHPSLRDSTSRIYSFDVLLSSWCSWSVCVMFVLYTAIFAKSSHAAKDDIFWETNPNISASISSLNRNNGEQMFLKFNNLWQRLHSRLFHLQSTSAVGQQSEKNNKKTLHIFQNRVKSNLSLTDMFYVPHTKLKSQHYFWWTQYIHLDLKKIPIGHLNDATQFPTFKSIYLLYRAM